jgi:hypothetical protein
MPEVVVSGISSRFRGLSQSEGQIAHVLLTRSPLVYPRRGLTARLACVKHAASVRPEPGSNSPLKFHDTPSEDRGAKLLEMSWQETESLTSSQNHRFLPKEPHDSPSPTPKGPDQAKPDGYQTNSSTFGTLLSSQGSSAHPSTSLPASLWGNLTKLTGPTRPCQFGPRAGDRLPDQLVRGGAAAAAPGATRSSRVGGRLPASRATGTGTVLVTWWRPPHPRWPPRK